MKLACLTDQSGCCLHPVALEGTPHDYWDTHIVSVQASQDPAAKALLYDWTTFFAWCDNNLNIQDHATRASENLQRLKHTGSALAYRSKFEVLAAKAKVPEHLQTQILLEGLRPDIKKQVLVDHNTHQGYTKMTDLVSAVLTVDAAISSAHALADQATDMLDTEPSPSSSAKQLTKRPASLVDSLQLHALHNQHCAQRLAFTRTSGVLQPLP